MVLEWCVTKDYDAARASFCASHPRRPLQKRDGTPFLAGGVDGWWVGGWVGAGMIFGSFTPTGAFEHLCFLILEVVECGTSQF